MRLDANRVAEADHALGDIQFVFTVQMATKFMGEDGLSTGIETGDRATLVAQLGE